MWSPLNQFVEKSFFDSSPSRAGQSHGEFNGAAFNGNFEAPIVVGNGSSADITGCLYVDVDLTPPIGVVM